MVRSMSFWSHVFASYVGVHVLPVVIGTAAVVGAGAYIAVRRGFNSASKSVSDGIDSIEDSMKQSEADRLLDDDDIVSRFSAMTSTEQSGLIPRWLKTNNTFGRVLTEKELSNLTQCLLTYTVSGSLSRPFYLTSNPETVSATLSLLEKNKGRIAEPLAAEIKGNILKTFAGIRTPTLASLDMAERLSKHYELTPEQNAICRTHVLDALSMPITASRYPMHSHIAKLEKDTEVQMKALDILLVPRHSHGGEKSSAHLSLQKGEYTPEETAKAQSEARKLISIWDNRSNDTSHLPYGFPRVKPQPNDTIQQAKKALGLPLEMPDTGHRLRLGA